MSSAIEAFVKTVFSLKGKVKFVPGRYRNFVLSNVQPIPLFVLPVPEGYYVPWKMVDDQYTVTVKLGRDREQEMQLDQEIEVLVELNKWSFQDKAGVSFYLK